MGEQGRSNSVGGVHAPERYWSVAPETMLQCLECNGTGLSSSVARKRLETFGPNRLRAGSELSRLRVLWNQVKSPLLLLLLAAALVSLVAGEWTDALIVATIASLSVGLGYYREHQALHAAALLQARLVTKAEVERDGVVRAVPVEDVVLGDIVLLAAGSLVPADCVVLSATDCHVSEAMLTGESYPVEKTPGPVAAETLLSKRTNCMYLGTNVRSGTARCVVVATAPDSEFGVIARRMSVAAPTTEFERGVGRFGYLLMSTMLAIVLLVFAAHMLEGRPPVETLLFAIALAVGLSPELLPAILTLNLSRSAQLMSKHGVLVRRLNAIENLGSMDVLCTDKTGTLTEGVVQFDGSFDALGNPDPRALELGAINAALETGLPSPLDDAVLAAHTPVVTSSVKLAEIPFDFRRKRVSVVVQEGNAAHLILKGAFHHVIGVCSTLGNGAVLDAATHERLEKLYAEWSSQGVRVLGVADRRLELRDGYTREQETDLRFIGFLTFQDRPKPGVSDAIAQLGRLGVDIKVITGDSRLVARHVAGLVGLRSDAVLTGEDLDGLHEDALLHAVEHTHLFAEVDPHQKERVLLALKKAGHVVGFLGDGVNDAPAMHAADTSISVEGAVDVARAAADFVLLERDLQVIRRGILEGRRTFANTLKYVLTTTSANLGNMVSMAIASLFLPFLPLLAGQILLNNFLSDIPAVGMADDDVDEAWVVEPRRWDIRLITRFMLFLGLLSSVFDLLTFAILLFVFDATPELFRTGWFVESLLTELVVALVVRTQGPVMQSKPGRLLLYSTLALIPITLGIPYIPYATVLGFQPLPASLLAALLGITLAYASCAEHVKLALYRRWPVSSTATPNHNEPGLRRNLASRGSQR